MHPSLRRIGATRSATDTTLKWFAWKLMFRVLSLLWLLMVALIFQHRRVITYDFLSNSSSSSEKQQQQQQYDPISNSSSEQQQHQQYDPISKSTFSEQQLPLQSPLRTRTSPSTFINVVGLAELTLPVGQQEQQLRRLLESKDDDILWRRRMLKGSGTPSSPSDMNHASKS